MNSSKTTGFSASELAALKLWSVPDVRGAIEAEADADVDDNAAVISEPVDFEVEPTPVLTVEEIEAMQKQAYDEAFTQGEKAGFQQGYEAGLNQGQEESQRLMHQQAAEFTSLLEALNEPFKLLDEEVEKELVMLAIGIATQIIRREIKMDPGQVVAAVREAIKVLPLSSQKISLHLHPEDADLVRSVLSLDEMSPAWTVVEAPLITRGGCQVDTDFSHIDATVENRLAAVIAGVFGGERRGQDKPE